ncbi:hypothetical protein IBT54_004998, partial [Pantoea sp. S62]|nr:hypothetical protein [Pantoea sp. S62]
ACSGQSRRGGLVVAPSFVSCKGEMHACGALASAACRCSFALCRDWIDRNMTTHLSRRNAMNTQNVNVNTATPESPKT